MQSSSYVPVAVLFCVAFLLFLGGFAVFFPQGLSSPVAGKVYLTQDNPNNHLVRHLSILQADFDALALRHGYSSKQLEEWRRTRETQAKASAPKSKAEDEHIRVCSHWATQFQLVKPDVPFDQMKQAMSPKQVSLWESRQCDQAIKAIGGLLSQLLPAPSANGAADTSATPSSFDEPEPEDGAGHAHGHGHDDHAGHSHATSTNTNTPASAPTPAPTPMGGGGAARDERDVFCEEAFRVHKVEPGVSWGTLPNEFRQRWIDMSCDVLALNQPSVAPVAPASDAPKHTPTPDEIEAKHHHHTEGHLNEQHHKKGSTSEEDNKSRQCIAWRKEHNVQPGVHWGTLPTTLYETWAEYECDNRLPEIILDRPTDKEMLEVAFKKPIPSPYDTSRNIVGIIICSTTRKLTVNSLGDLVLFQQVIPGIAKHAEAGVEYWIFLGFDEGDKFFDKPHRPNEMINWFNSNVAGSLDARGIKSKFIPHKIVGNTKNKPGFAFNQLAQVAYESGVHWFYRINDDSVPSAPFAKTFIATLQAMPQPMGVVGPICHSGNTQILTHDFVHRTHMDIFDVYYPTILSDWWMDDWITRVYGRKRTRRMDQVSIDHTLRHGTRYEVDFAHGGMLQKEVNAGRVRIVSWMKQHGMSEGDLMDTLQDKTTYSVSRGR